MAKTIICLVLTAVFAFLSLSSYTSTDAPRMRRTRHRVPKRVFHGSRN